MTVMGLGNSAMGDDGIGVEIAEILRDPSQRAGWRGDVDVINAGGDAVLAGSCLAQGEEVLLVDAVDMKRAPGTWRMFSAHDLLQCHEPAGCTTHALSLAGVIEMARALGCADRLRILGIQVEDVRPGRSLSPRVRECVPAVLARIREEVEALS
jgi:hydrogenase maturation protease